MARLILIILFSVACLSGCGGGGGGGSPEVESFPPTSIAYPNFGPFMVGSPINPIECIVVGGMPDLWTVTPAFPDGLLLDPKSGAISGTPLEFQAPTPHTVFAQNDSGQVTVVISIFVLPASPCDIDFGATQFQFEQDTPLVPIEPSFGCGPAELWTITPTLPEGLLFSITTGTISGTPVLPAVATDYLVIASNPFGQESASISIEVLLIAPCDLQYPAPVQTLVVGEELPLQLPSSSCGAADSYSISPALAPGLSLDATSGGISGIALDTATTTSHTITAANGVGSSQFQWTLTVQPAAPCDLLYPLSLLSLGVGDSLTPLSPTSGCGDADSFTVTPALPPGIVLDAVTGLLEGIALQVQEATSYQLTASNVTGQTSFELVIEVLIQPPCDLVYPSALLTLQVGVPLADQVPSVACGPVSLYQNIPALPAGLILDLISGVISGTPTAAAGSASYLIEASNSSGLTTTAIQITVLPQPPCDLQYPVSAQTLIVGEDLPVQLPTSGCGAVDSYSITPALPTGLSLDATSGGISGIALDTATTTIHVITAANVSGESIFLWTLTVQPLAPCDLSYPLAVLSLDVGDTLTPLSPTTSCGDPETFTVVPALPTGIVLDPDSGVLAGIALQDQEATSYQLTASNVTGQTSFGLVIEVQPQAPCDLVYPSATLTLQVGVPLADQVPSVGCGPVSLYQSAPALPAGLNLDTVSGVISGTPTVALNSASYQIEASNSKGFTTTSIQITVLPQPPCDLQYPVVDIVLTVGEALAPLAPTSGCGPIDVYTTIPPLPAGLSIDLETGLISGTALLESGRSDHVVIGGNASGSTSVIINVTVNPAAPCDLQYSTSVLSLIVAEDIGVLIPTVGCGAVDVWSVAPALPVGMIFDATSGTISGAATSVQDPIEYLIEANNVSGSVSTLLTIEVLEPAPCDLQYPDADLVLIVGEVVDLQLPVVGCGAPTEFSIDPPLAAGLTFDALTGAIEGTPSQQTAQTMHLVTAANSIGATSTNLTIEVIGLAPCDLQYPLAVLAHPAGVAVVPLIPQVACGAVELWSVTPALPAGLQIDPLTGILSGQALADGDSLHLIRAENEFGFVEVSLEILIRNIFLFHAEPLTIGYSVATGQGSGSLALLCQEGTVNPGYPTPLAGISLAIQYDPLLLDYAGVDQGADLAILNGGTGPDFWAVNPVDGAVLIGALVSFTFGDVLVCDGNREIAVVHFETHAATLQGNASGVSGSLPWGNPGTIPPLDNLVVVDGTTSVDPIVVPVPLQLTPQ